MSERRHLIQLSRIALAVAAIDLGTKAAAKRLLIQDPGVFSSPLQLAVVHNNAGAFGWSAGIYTWQLNLALTLAAIVFMIPVTRDLARIDSSAPRALGLIVGGALGNLASLVTSPKGVIDFIAINFESWGIVLNVADVAAYLGLAMILRTGCLIALAIVRDRRVAVVRERSTVRAVFAEHAAARASRRVGGSDDWVRRPELEVAVGGLGLLRDKPPLLADGAREVEREVVVFDLEVARRRRSVVDEVAPPLAHQPRIEPSSPPINSQG